MSVFWAGFLCGVGSLVLLIAVCVVTLVVIDIRLVNTLDDYHDI